MMGKGAAVHFAIAAGLFLTPVMMPAAAREPTVLSPSSAWQLDYARGGCRLSRGFGEGEDRVMLVLDQYEHVDKLGLILAGQPLQPLVRRDYWVAIRFDPDGRDMGFLPGVGALGELSPALIFTLVRLDPVPEGFYPESPPDARADYHPPFTVSAERKAAADRIVLGVRGQDYVVLETGSFGKPFAAMDGCLDSLVAFWGLDPVAVAEQQRPPVPKDSPSGCLTWEDYPERARNRGQMAVVNFRLMVDAQGSATSCHIQGATEPPGFEEPTCEALMSRASFEPALDGDGNPAASFYNGVVRFVM